MADEPFGLGAGGLRLWHAVADEHDLDVPRLAQLEEACRAKDRCDRLNDMLSAEHDSKLQADANTTANLMKQLIAALRLPDPESGKRPQFRGTPRGAVAVQQPGGKSKVSSLDRARARKSG